MTPGEIRTAMLAEHAEARAMIRRCEELAASVRAGGDTRDELRATLGRLADVLRAHNDREEELLREIIPTVDAWGPARASVMVEQHHLEHHALHAAIVGARDGLDDAAPASLEALLADLIKHMNREEEAFLSDEVLRDDAVAMYYFGG